MGTKLLTIEAFEELEIGTFFMVPNQIGITISAKGNKGIIIEYEDSGGLDTKYFSSFEDFRSEYRLVASNGYWVDYVGRCDSYLIHDLKHLTPEEVDDLIKKELSNPQLGERIRARFHTLEFD